MKVLLSAYACEAGRGSEPGVGWHTARELAKYHEVWVLTRPDDGRPAIEAELARNPEPNLHFVYFTLPLWGGFWQLGSVAFVLHYYLWQVQAYFVARQLHREIRFDLAHHVTFVRYSTPSFISLLPIPFIWGPVGGGESAPPTFWQDFSFKAKIYEIMRTLAHKVGEQDPFARLTARRSTITRVTTEDTAERVRKMGASNVQVLSQLGLSKKEIGHLARYTLPSSSQVRLISIGRLLHWKGFHLGLSAFAQAGLADAEYWVIGDGPERERLQSLVEELGIAHQIMFWGELSRDETLQKLGECHVLVHPSLHDSGGLVCLEAMAAGHPVICLDLGGPAIQVTPETGFKIPAHNPAQTVSDLADAMICLAHDPKLRIRMGQAGQNMVEEKYNWETKGQHLAKFYEKIFLPGCEYPN
ncbi:MAG: glycosyltransferase family 4 protein [Symploca sp. SIO2E9]|nr:glycosyltransferase family 4 protein [Symploca sp. SIO2E9]